MFNYKEIKNKKFNKLTALEFVQKKGNVHFWLFLCDCGNKKVCQKNAVTCGNTKSCGCILKEITSKRSKTHGLSHSRFERIWIGIKGRIYNKNIKNYKTYGGRGIKCLWNDFLDFRNDMYASYIEHVKKHGEKDTTIDRIDVNGNYEKSNCRWATMKIQQNNRTNNKKPTYIVTKST